MARFFSSIAACAVLVACGSDSMAPSPGRPLSELRAAPRTAALGGAVLRLVPFVYRDFQPISPRDGKPMIAGLRVETVDASGFPSGVRADSAWVIFGEEVWAAAVREEIASEPDSPSRQWVIRGGPKWGPGVLVDVVVKLVEVGGSAALLLAPDQFVQRTD